MGWDYDRSLERIRQHLDRMPEIEIEKLVREADLEQLLSETRCRQVYGAHVYVQVSNFARLSSDGSSTDDAYKRLIRSVHIYQREVSRIVEQADIFDGLRVHFQGAKLHALFYRPIDDGEELATRAVLLQLVLKDFVRSVFNPAFPDYEDFTIAGGADLGDAIGTRNGARGDRELLFLGSPANHAAKFIENHAGRLRITLSVLDALPDDLRDLCTETEPDVFQVDSVTAAELDELLDAHGIAWDREASADRIEEDKERFPLKDVTYSAADTLIDLDALSIYSNKRVLAASLFADVSGFTAYIDDAETQDDQRSALRVFHAIRREMARVIREDFDGLRIQYQGDRAQGLFHLPKDDEEAIAVEAVEAAAGLQASMEFTVKDCLADAASLRLAVGIDTGMTLVSKLGTRAHRDRICLGEAVEAAARCEERSEGGQIGITGRVHAALPDDLRELFTSKPSDGCYIADGLTADKLERAIKGSRVYRPGASVYIRAGAAGVTITEQDSPGARRVVPSRSYSP